MSISNRLLAIVNMVPNSESCADIGADHGQLIIYLVNGGVIKHGVAVENKEGPYKTLVKSIKKSGLEEQITTILGSGLQNLDANEKVVVIAGMGTNSIISILDENKMKLSNIETLVIDSHTDIPLLREKLIEYGFYIDEEEIIEENKVFYEIIRFKKGEVKYSKEEIEFGPCLLKKNSLIFKKKYILRISSIENLLQNPRLSEERKEQLNNERMKYINL